MIRRRFINQNTFSHWNMENLTLFSDFTDGLRNVIKLCFCFLAHIWFVYPKLRWIWLQAALIVFWTVNMKAIDCTVNHDKGLGIDTWFSEEKTKPLLYFSVALWAACLKSISINDFEITPRLNPNFITRSHICWVSFNYISLEKENQSCLSTVIYPTKMSTKSQTNTKRVFDKFFSSAH